MPTLSWASGPSTLRVEPLEATGGYEQRIAKALEASHHVAVVNPLHVRNFAKSRGRLAKTDKLDARLLAEFGEVNKPRMTRALSDVEGRLRAAVQRRDQVADLRQLAKQHVEHTDDPTMLREAKKLVATLHDEVRKLDAIVAKILKDDAVLKARATRMRTMPGIGPIIAAALLVYLPELGSISKGQVPRIRLRRPAVRSARRGETRASPQGSMQVTPR